VDGDASRLIEPVPQAPALATDGNRPAGNAAAPIQAGRGRKRLVNLFLYLAFPGAVLVVWQILASAGFYRRAILPPPTDIATVLVDLILGNNGEAGRYSGSWPDHALSSLWRVYIGFAWGGAFGTLLGLLIGLSRPVEKLFDPTVQVLRNVQVTAWVPLSIVFFGIGNQPAIFLIGLGAFFPAVLNSTHGVRQLNRTLHKAGQMMGANQHEMLVRVILPAALPSVMTGLRLSMGIAWVLVVVAEILAVRSGLGNLLNDAYQFYRNDVVIAAMLSIGVLGFLSDRIVLLVRDRLLEWNRLESFDG
jgi:NitT/TauT family transport system permease protein